MLDLALNHVEELKFLFRKIWFDDKYKFYNFDMYHSDFEISTDTQGAHQLVSVDGEGNVIGYICYSIARQTLNVGDLEIINFTDDIYTFGSDMKRVFKDIFEKFHFRKLSFSVVVGNPIEPQYDKLIKKYGGRIVGIQEAQTKLIDNKYYDVKLYEILEDQYYNAKALRKEEK